MLPPTPDALPLFRVTLRDLCRGDVLVLLCVISVGVMLVLLSVFSEGEKDVAK